MMRTAVIYPLEQLIVTGVYYILMHGEFFLMVVTLVLKWIIIVLHYCGEFFSLSL